MRLIDADALMDSIFEKWGINPKYLDDSLDAMKDVQTLEWINSAPSIDIVRCKECRYWDNEPFDSKTIGRCLLLKDYMNMATIEEAYCYGGKRAEQTERSE